LGRRFPLKKGQIIKEGRGKESSLPQPPNSGPYPFLKEGNKERMEFFGWLVFPIIMEPLSGINKK